ATQKVASGLYMLMGVNGFTGGNLGLSIGDDGVVLIDDSMPPFLDKMNKAIKDITKQPIDFLINTHVHGDHIGNNESLAKNGTYIVAHENLREHLINKGIGSGENKKAAPKAILPVITFSQSMNFHLNGHKAHVFHVANAHTDGDAVIHFTDLNVIHTGDTMFNKMFPYIDIASGGSVEGYIAAQKQMLALANDQTKIIPGHGELASKADLVNSIAMLEDARDLVKALIDQGKSEEEVVKLNPLAKYHDKWNWRFITTERMTRQLYQGLAGKKVAQQKTEHSHGSGGHSH
ncbi:MAG: MBL fold metallo-hydrolase, partial [Gammaproteobacteria bacterium]|nr:MBL fold metallo-hydrolase [Gammaproteobacteria bacterium]